MSWHDTPKRNVFVFCFSNDAGRDHTRAGAALRSYDIDALAPGAWYGRTSAGLNRVLADLRAALGDDCGARFLVVDATEDQCVGWPRAAWPQLAAFQARYGAPSVERAGEPTTSPALHKAPASSWLAHVEG